MKCKENGRIEENEACPYEARVYGKDSRALMTNFDHTISEGAPEILKACEARGQYSGVNFCGWLWWDRKRKVFRCEVWQHHSLVDVVDSETLEGIMKSVSDKYGWE